MRFNHTLYLASKSQARRKLLDIAQIPYEIIQQTSDECGVDASGTFDDYVLAIAKHKMKSIILPENISGDTIFVLTADTLMRTAKTKQILGKPVDKNHAKQMLGLLREEEAELVTGCCLDKKELRDKRWETVQEEHWVTPATLSFCVPKDMVVEYFAQMPHAMSACGAGIVEEFGYNFLKSVSGSFTSILGLPLFELREKLKEIGFN